MPISEINFDEVTGRGGNLGVITLNRPKALNALTLPMINVLDHQLMEWAEASHIKAVIIRAVEGKAFCAGGDIRDTYLRKQKNETDYFFREEYQLNARIFHYPKPYVALLHGITMGGGAGISIHGSHRVAAQNLLFAMPETGIGFYPDVGATYFLSRLPNKIGFYLGLTGARISADDCFNIGLIEAIVKEENFPEIIYEIADTAFNYDEANQAINDIIHRFMELSKDSALFSNRDKINNYFSEPTVEDIIRNLSANDDPWCQEVLSMLKTKSPTSLKVTLIALQRAAKMDFDECMQMEAELTAHFLMSHDLFEGIRAVVIDKDQSPEWQPRELSEVDNEQVESFFDKVGVN